MRSLLLASCLLAPAVFASTAGASVSPPAATGAAPVGFTRTTLTDAFRSESLAGDIGPRRLALRVWYPAAAPGAARPARSARPSRPPGSGGAGLERSALDGLGSAATADAPAAAREPPGPADVARVGRDDGVHGRAASDLASHGYVVVGIDVPGETEAVDLGDGVLAPMAPGLAKASVASIELRSRDMRFVLSRLGSLRGAGRLDLERVGAFGHSNGGATTATAMLADRRIRAGVNLDGGDLRRRRPARARPAVRHVARRRPGRGVRDDVRVALAPARPAPATRTSPRAPHNSFTDYVWLVPQLGLDPEGDWRSATIDPASAVVQADHVAEAISSAVTSPA